MAVIHIYRLRSEGDNVLSSVRPSASALKNDYQSKVFVCMSIISECVRIIIAQMQSIGF